MDPLTMMMIAQGVNMGLKWLNRPKRRDLSKLKMTDADVNRLYSSAMTKVARPVQGQLQTAAKGIRQAGVMGRLPAGAVAAAMGGAQYRAGQAVTEAGAGMMPEILNMKRKSEIDYMNAQADQDAEQSQWGQSFSSDLGYMTQMAILSKAGYFDNPESTAGLMKPGAAPAAPAAAPAETPFSGWNMNTIAGFNPRPTPRPTGFKLNTGTYNFVAPGGMGMNRQTRKWGSGAGMGLR